MPLAVILALDVTESGDAQRGVTEVAVIDGGVRTSGARAGDHELMLVRDDHGRLVDVGTGSIWHSVTGEAIAGPPQGTVLDQAPVTRAFWFAWSSLV